MADEKQKQTDEQLAAQYVPPLQVIFDKVREAVGLGRWRRRNEPAKIHHPHEDYSKNYVVLPQEWTGKHLLKRDEIVAALPGEYRDNRDFRQLAISIGLVDEFYLEGLGDPDDPETWDISGVPLPVLSWLIEIVYNDFLSAAFIPK